MSTTSSGLGSGPFSELTILETMRLSGSNCWACYTDPPQICHVVTQEDTQTEVWERAGLFTFSYRSATNAIPLCATCHAQFDLAVDPGYVFFPTDLRYFVDYEIQDCERRRVAAEAGLPVKRQVPSAVEYRDHHQQTGAVPRDTVGGLYSRIFLKAFPYGGMFPDVLRALATPREWHGSPMASIRRAMAALGSPRFYVVEPKVRHDLEKLRDLYFGSPGAVDPLLRSIYRQDEDAQSSKRRLEEGEEEEVWPGQKRVKIENEERNAGVGSANQGRDHLQSQCQDWDLGPDVTANEAIKLYGPLFSD